MQAIRSTLCMFEKRARAVAILETVSTTFEGSEHEDGTLTGKYFNQIIGDLKRFNRGRVLGEVVSWMGFVRKGEPLPAGDATMHF